MAAVIPVGASAVKISGTASKPYLISNDANSQTVIYLGQDSNVSPNNYGVKLLPGGSLTWTEITREVWAISSTSNTANVTVLYEATATFSSQVSAVNANAPVLLSTTTVTLANTGGFSVSTTIPDLAIGNYASIKIMVSVNLTAIPATTPTLLTGAAVQFNGIQSNTAPVSAGASVTNRATFPFGDNGGSGLGLSTGLQPGIQTLEYPVINNYLSGSTIAYNSGTSTLAGTLTLRIFGQGKALNQSIYTSWNGGSLPTVYNGYQASEGVMFNTTVSGAATTSYSIPSQNGIANILMSSGSTTLTRVGYSLYFYDYASSSYYLVHKRLLAAPGTIGDSINDQVIFPQTPVQLRLETTGTGSSIYSVTQIV
jgi:hypothetical protein